MPTTTSRPPDLSGPLGTAACLIATAALVRAAGGALVRVVVSGTGIDVQVPPGSGEQSAREAAVAAYARVLDAPVTRRHSRIGTGAWTEAWTETRGDIGGHDVHVWTITDPLQEA
jgi:hypothetical protein